MVARYVDALAVLEHAALVDAADDAVGIGLLDQNRNQTVVEQQLSADRAAALGEEDIDKLGIGYRNARKISLIQLLVKREIAALFQLGGAVLKGGDAHLGTLGIEHDRHVLSALGDRLADVREHARKRVMGSVGHVDSGYVHSRVDHLQEHFLGVARGTDGTYDFCFSHC